MNQNNDIHSNLQSNIATLRYDGKVSEAIDLCLKATEQYESTYFYPKILGDLYLLKNKYEDAAKAYLTFLERINPSRKLFVDFARRYNRLKRSLSGTQLKQIVSNLIELIAVGKLHPQLSKWLESLVANDISDIAFSEAGLKLIKAFETNEKFSIIVNKLKTMEQNNPIELFLILNSFVLDRSRTENTFSTDSYCVAVYERFNKYDEALRIGIDLIDIRQDPILIRTIFRICRKIQDYSIATKILETHQSITKARSDFNILYELVYYYEFFNDIESLTESLHRIEQNGLKSIPIQKTVKNFYISFGMLEDVKRVDDRIANSLSGSGKEYKKYGEVVKESEEEISSKIKELYSKVEHHERLAAISDLTTGISHELGQPITNIRYTIQFYYKLFEKNNSVDMKILFSLFDSILVETSRMGDLVKRLAPLTSSRNIIQDFNIADRISDRINALDNRFKSSDIKLEFKPTKPIHLIGDPVHFDQIINNLILNSIDSIDSLALGKTKEKKISINLEEDDKKVKLTVMDTGAGIEMKLRSKIFDPFYTTKEPGKGEGLGLFIIWNLLKMHGGKIELDHKYKNGAKFTVVLPKKAKINEEI